MPDHLSPAGRLLIEPPLSPPDDCDEDDGSDYEYEGDWDDDDFVEVPTKGHSDE